MGNEIGWGTEIGTTPAACETTNIDCVMVSIGVTAVK